MGGGRSRSSSLFTSDTDSEARRLDEDELADLRERLNEAADNADERLNDDESVPDVTSFGTSETDEPRVSVTDDNSEGAGDEASGGGGSSGTGVETRVGMATSVPSEIGGGDPGDGESTAEPGVAGGPVDTAALPYSPPDLSDADSPGERARELLRGDAIAPRNRSGEGERLFDTVESGGNIGGWREFEYPDADSRQWLDDTGEVTGRTSAHMEIAHIRPPALQDPPVENPDGDYELNKAYVTHYDQREDVDRKPPMNDRAPIQLGQAAWADAIGANVPTHAYDPERNLVAAEGFPGEAARKVSSAAAEQVDHDELVDQVAVQMMSGNTDLHSGNLFVSDDGTPAFIDLDIARGRYDDMDEFRRRVDLRGVNRVSGKGGPEVTTDEVVQRAKEIAVGLHNDGAVDDVVEQVAAHEQAAGARGERVADNLLNNLDMLVSNARDDTNTGNRQ